MPKVRKESLPFFIPVFILSLIFLKLYILIGIIFLALSAFILYFFRDPEKNIPQNSENLIIAPADGKIITLRKVTSEEQKKFHTTANASKISIFMNVFNVHVNRAPITGKITHLLHTKGKKLPAFREKSSELNEHTDIQIQNKNTTISLRLIAGLVAQRIVTFKEKNYNITAGERMNRLVY